MSRSSLPPDAQPSIPADTLLLNADLGRWAGASIARSGRREALLGRVEWLRLTPDGLGLEARVRGNRPLPYLVKVWIEERRLGCRCSCAPEMKPGCKHAVAALEALRFPLAALPRDRGTARRRAPGRAGRGKGRIVHPASGLPGFLVLGGPERTLTREERIGLAREEERLLRRQRARRPRLKVSLLEPAGGPPRFSVVGDSDGACQTVTLRGLKAERPGCDCADYAANELGTCVHIERVRRWYSRKKKSIATDVLSCWWSPRAWVGGVPEVLREIRIECPEGTRPPVLTRYFDDEGWLRAGPAGIAASAWARRAVAAARRAARKRDWHWELDPAVSRRISSSAGRDRLDATLRPVQAGSREWTGIVSRLGFRLHPYQELGALFLARAGRAFLADDMGLGKTVQSIAAALLLRGVAGARKALVVCPASLKHQWRREIERACGERATVLEAARGARLAAYRSWREGFLILNYELVLRDLEAIRAARPDLVILDEAQRIKNWDTKTAQAVKRLDSRHAFILTGTPLENRLLELHSLVEFLHPRALGPRWRLLPFHAVTETHGRIVAYEGLEILRKRLRGFFLRRERSEVLDQLPERTDNTFWIGMTATQRRPYRKHAATVAAMVSRNEPLRPLEIRVLLQSLTRMRILCNAHAQYDWENVQQRLRDSLPPGPAEIRALASPKLEEFTRVLEDLLDESDEKIVVFSQWERMLRLAEFVAREALAARDLRAEVFHGGLSSRARAAMLDAFNLDPEFRVLFSTDAGSQGLNLQEAASVVVNLEVPWNPAVLEQRVGRVHRLGQQRSVRVLHFVTRQAIEERVRQVVEEKRALFEGLLVDEVDRIVFDEDRRATFVHRISDLIEVPAEPQRG